MIPFLVLFPARLWDNALGVEQDKIKPILEEDGDAGIEIG